MTILILKALYNAGTNSTDWRRKSPGWAGILFWIKRQSRWIVQTAFLLCWRLHFGLISRTVSTYIYNALHPNIIYGWQERYKYSVRIKQHLSSRNGNPLQKSKSISPKQRAAAKSDFLQGTIVSQNIVTKSAYFPHQNSSCVTTSVVK